VIRGTLTPAGLALAISGGKVVTYHRSVFATNEGWTRISAGNVVTDDSDSIGADPDGISHARTATLSVALVVLPVIAFFLLIHTYAVDVIRADQWYDIRLIQRSSTGTLSLSTLWAQHSENRIFFQNLITLLLAYATHFNVLVEDYLSVSMLAAAATLVIWTHHARSTSTRWIFYVPIALLMLSVVQWEIGLFGFDIGWSLILLSLASTVCLLDRPRLTNGLMAAAIAAAVVGSFSSLQGLLIWPVGLTLLLQRRRSGRQVTAWIAAAFTTTVTYFINWSSVTGGSSGSYAFKHPISSIKFFFAAIGDVAGVPISGSPSPSNTLIEVLGVTIVAGAIWVLFAYGLRRDKTSGRPVGVALVWFGLLFAMMITGARASSGLPSAGVSRYTTFDLLILVGCYLVMLDPSMPFPTVNRAGQQAPIIFRLVVIGTICVQIVLGSIQGVSSASSYHRSELIDADIIANIRMAPDGLIQSQLAGVDQPAGFVRELTRFAAGHRLSLFSTNHVAYVRGGLPVDQSPPQTKVLRPTSGALLHGNQWLVAGASDEFGVTRVEFEISYGGHPYTLIGRATRTPFGWLGGWSTSTVMNGMYALKSVAIDADGLTSFSQNIVVTVKNQ
jgi:hypothetical protein